MHNPSEESGNAQAGNPSGTAPKDDFYEEGARPSSLIPVHRPAIPDPLHDLNLLRMVQVANERTVRELGPLPPGGLPVVPKRKPKTRLAQKPVTTPNEEDETMKLKQMAAAAALAAGTVGALSVPTSAETPKKMDGASSSEEAGNAKPIGDQKEPSYRKAFHACMDESNGVTVDMMNCMNDEFDYQDKRMNLAYQRLHKVLTTAQWISLRDEQRKWLADRDNCEVDDDIKGGTAEMLVRQDCSLRKTAFRADELEVLLKKNP